jgi:NitT/TauT family transport system substrate-binding protein
MLNLNLNLNLRLGLTALALGFLSLDFVGAAHAQGSNAPLTKIVCGQTSVSAAWANLYMADSLGYFAKHGVQIEFVTVPGGQTGDAALLNGSVDFLIADLREAFLLQNKNQDVKVVTGIYRPLIHALVVRNGESIQSLKDLKGKKIGITARGTGTYYLAKYLLIKAGYTEDDATLVPLGPTPAGWVAAFQGGTVDAGFSFDPITALLLNGQKTAHVLYNLQAGEGPSELARRYYVAAVFNEKFVNAHIDAVKGFVAAIKEAQDYLNDSSHHVTIIQALTKYINVPPEVLAQSFASAAAVNNAFDVRVTSDHIAAETDYLQAVGMIPPSFKPTYSDIVDTRFN